MISQMQSCLNGSGWLSIKLNESQMGVNFDLLFFQEPAEAILDPL